MMKHPIALLIPVLMILDYAMTLWGYRLYHQGYGQHIKIPSYELNPQWQTDIANRRWSPRFFVLVALVTFLVIFFSEVVSPDSTEMLSFFFGAILGVYAVILGRHVSNVFIFRFVARNVEALTGEVQMSQILVLTISRYQLIPILLILISIVVVVPEYFTVGSLVGVSILGLVHFVWLRQQQTGQRSISRWILLLGLGIIVVLTVLISLLTRL